MLNFEGVSKSYDLFGTNRTSPEIQVKADLTLKDASGGTVLHAAALMGLLDLLPYRMAGKKGEVKFQFGKVIWKWDMMDLKMFRNYVFHLEIMFCSLMMWDDEGVFLGWATGILFWIFVAWSISCFMIPASLSQHEKGNMMRLRHHICFVWRLLYQAFEIRHDWSLINSFHSLESESSICLKPESWVPPFAGVSKNGSMFLCFHVGQTKKKNIHKDNIHVTSLGCWMMFPTPHERGAIALSPSQMYRWLLRVFTEDSVQHFKVKDNRFGLSLLLSILRQKILGEKNQHVDSTELGQTKPIYYNINYI